MVAVADSDIFSSSVDELDQCNKIVGNDDNRARLNSSKLNPTRKSTSRKYFPFKQGYLSVATLRVGSEGIQMTVDGKHVTSFAYREVSYSSICSCL